MPSVKDDLKSLLKFLIIYYSRKTRGFLVGLERFKNLSVGFLMHRRGRFQKHVWHTSMVGLALVGILTSGALGGGDSVVASRFPGLGGQDPRTIETFDPNASGISLQSFIDFKTTISEKPRAEIIDYDVKGGETLSQIAEKYQISTDTVKWANDLESVNSIKPGQTLKILPVSGVAHTVAKGDTLESVAKKYEAESQAIVEFPFNDIPDDFKLRVGQVLIVPDGHPPEKKPVTPRRQQPSSLAQGPGASSFSAPGGGSFIWPTTTSGISTYFAWWHPGLDMPNRSAPAVVASDGGTVTVSGWPDNYGYGNRVVIDHGNGYQTLYAHLSNIYVSAGQKVSRGQSVGQMGTTGRSTGIHLHFEIRYKGVAVNPLAILK